ncbi:hypothetical protein RHCRD62_30099 [Rhodococcus sp. RD6.2]|nr:hypothetical protein RHCRD62_30099 [Rhodococcus sp. RD6.2]
MSIHMTRYVNPMAGVGTDADGPLAVSQGAVGDIEGQGPRVRYLPRCLGSSGPPR